MNGDWIFYVAFFGGLIWALFGTLISATLINELYRQGLFRKVNEAVRLIIMFGIGLVAGWLWPMIFLGMEGIRFYVDGPIWNR